MFASPSLKMLTPYCNVCWIHAPSFRIIFCVLLLHLCFKCVIKILMYIVCIVLLREVTVFWTKILCILNCISYFFSCGQ